MKRAATALLSCVAIAFAQAHQPGRDMVSVDLGKGKVTIDYGTPSLNGRSIDDLIVPGTPWRLGMNDPTTLETSVGLDFSGKKLQPGKYTLFARPDEKKNWTLLVCKGSQPATAVVEAPLHFMKEDKPVEVLKITLAKSGQGASLVVAWGTYRLHGSFKAA